MPLEGMIHQQTKQKDVQKTYVELAHGAWRDDNFRGGNSLRDRKRRRVNNLHVSSGRLDRRHLRQFECVAS